MTSAIIFDLDGTLLYTLEDLTDSVNFVLAKYDYPIRTVDEIKNFVGNGVSVLMERALPDGKNNPNFNKCTEMFKTNYAANMFNKTKPYEHITDVLQKLKDDGYKLAVVSNKFDSAVKELCKKYFDNLIDVAIGQGVNVKPSPDSVFEAAKLLGVKVEDCVFVGDSEVDIQTAQNAGIPCISVTWGYKDIDFLYNNGAGVLVYSPEELLELL